MRILMVCLGNICRSPIAEGVMKNKCAQAGLNWLIESAGTQSYHIGEPPHPDSIRICRENGIDISSQRARKFQPAVLDHYDHIYALATDVLEDIYDICGRQANYNHLSLFLDTLHPGAHESVPDPYYLQSDAYAEVFEQISIGCDAILHSLNPVTTQAQTQLSH